MFYFIILLSSNLIIVGSSSSSYRSTSTTTYLPTASFSGSCPSYQVKCNNTLGKCIPIVWVCDRDNDCGDNSDEINCKYSTTPILTTSTPFSTQTNPTTTYLPNNGPCSIYEVKCNTTIGRCIPSNWVCDRFNDCGDNSDEINCDFAITSTTTITPSSYHPPIDGCYDNGKYQIKCNNTGHCLWYTYARCNGVNDCGDNTDEKDCGLCVAPYEFKCATYDLCIPAYSVCDGYKQCSDNSDELNCPNTTYQITPGPNGECDTSYAVTCNKTGKCIMKEWICDNYDDCGDKSDEVNCTYTSYSPTTLTTPMRSTTQNGMCNYYQFKCVSDGGCIPLLWKCDNWNDCPDSSDEQNCTFSTYTTRSSSISFTTSILTTTTSPNIICNSNQMACSSPKKCIPIAWKCDEENDCGDNSDEQNCNGKK